MQDHRSAAVPPLSWKARGAGGVEADRPCPVAPMAGTGQGRKVSLRRDSNPRPPSYQDGALPLRHRGRCRPKQPYHQGIIGRPAEILKADLRL
jgi:hypothetical protein